LVFFITSKKALILVIALKEVTIFMLSLVQKFTFLVAETTAAKEVCSAIPRKEIRKNPPP
jgi:hypothetical protein